MKMKQRTYKFLTFSLFRLVLAFIVESHVSI